MQSEKERIVSLSLLTKMTGKWYKHKKDSSQYVNCRLCLYLRSRARLINRFPVTLSISLSNI